MLQLRDVLSFSLTGPFIEGSVGIIPTEIALLDNRGNRFRSDHIHYMVNVF